MNTKRTVAVTVVVLPVAAVFVLYVLDVAKSASASNVLKSAFFVTEEMAAEGIDVSPQDWWPLARQQTSRWIIPDNPRVLPVSSTDGAWFFTQTDDRNAPMFLVLPDIRVTIRPVENAWVSVDERRNAFLVIDGKKIKEQLVLNNGYAQDRHGMQHDVKPDAWN